jgi:hypothetical protein
MIEVRVLNTENFGAFVQLLQQRGETPSDFYMWKYLNQPVDSKICGFIAYKDDHPVGCIGVIHKIFVDGDGNGVPATWFADWFVSLEVRGEGVGKMLMEEVRKMSHYNFGIPGPPDAQRICKKAGYEAVDGFIELSLYLNSFRCGSLRYKSSFLISGIRGLKQAIYGLSTWIRVRRSQLPLGWKKGFPDAFKWQTRLREDCRTSLFDRTSRFMSWLEKMPVATNSERWWWSIDNAHFFAAGFVERDFWGLQKATVMDYSASTPARALIWQMARILSEHKVDWVSLCMMDNEGKSSFSGWNKVNLPLHWAGRAQLPKMRIAQMDKDSAWRSFLFKG